MTEPVRRAFLSGDFGDPRTAPGREASLPPIRTSPYPVPGLVAAARLGFLTAAHALRRRRLLLVGFLGVALALAAGAIERRVGAPGAVDRSLRATFGLLIPLGSFAVVLEATRHDRLGRAAWPVARYGVARRDVALGIALAALLGAAVLGVLFAGTAVVGAHTASSAPLARDLFVSCRVGALSACAYVGWFALGATFFARGRGIWIPLVADFLLGDSAGIFGAVFPRGNALSLVGGAAPLGLAQPVSSLILFCTASFLAIAAALRCRE